MKAYANSYNSTISVLLNVWSVQATASQVVIVGGPATHSVFAAYGGDTAYTASNSGTVNLSRGVSTSLTLNASSGTVQAGQTVQLTATLTPNTYNGITATGTVTFYDGSTQIGVQTLNSSGQAVMTTGGLTAGSHNFSAVYAGDSNFAAATGTTVVRAQFTSTTTLSVSSHSATAGTAVRFTATVLDQNSAPVTNGSVQFCDATVTYCEIRRCWRPHSLPQRVRQL